MICWYCHWGWSKPVADIYDQHVRTAGEWAMRYGPSHIVWEDENFEREHVQWCLDHFDEHHADFSTEELAAVKQSLLDLLALPDSVLDPEPEAFKDAEDADPRDYPPPEGIVMVRAR